MKALSVRQPWAWAIIEGHKTIKNRKWYPRDLSGDFAIHAPSVFEAETHTTLTLTFPEFDWRSLSVSNTAVPSAWSAMSVLFTEAKARPPTPGSRVPMVGCSTIPAGCHSSNAKAL